MFANLWSFCATRPSDLRAAGYPAHPDDDRHILTAAMMGDGRVVCAWGANARGHPRPTQVLTMIRAAGFLPVTLRLLADGVPEHPLMLPYSCTLINLSTQPAPAHRT